MNFIILVPYRLNLIISLQVCDPNNVNGAAITTGLNNQLDAAAAMFNINFAPVQRYGECFAPSNHMQTVIMLYVLSLLLSLSLSLSLSPLTHAFVPVFRCLC